MKVPFVGVERRKWAAAAGYADINVDPYEVNSIILNADQMQDFAITMAQFGEMFDRFCYDNITRLNRSKSWKKLREVLIHFAEYYLGFAHKLAGTDFFTLKF